MAAYEEPTHIFRDSSLLCFDDGESNRDICNLGEFKKHKEGEGVEAVVKIYHMREK